MAQTLIVYPNCSKGGITSVVRGRAAAEPNKEFHFIATQDKGGRDAFDDLPNVEVHIVDAARLTRWLNYVLISQKIEELSLIASPEIVDELRVPPECRFVYEFHSSNLAVVESELRQFDTSLLDDFRTPTDTMASSIRRIADEAVKKRLKVVHNLVDSRYFNTDTAMNTRFQFNHIPLVWVGRFQEAKGLKYAFRTVARLPSKYSLHVVLSLTDATFDAADALGEAHSLGIESRISVYQNLSQKQIADLFRSAAEAQGALLSTSLNESYGYIFHEATATDLPIFAFSLPVLSEFQSIENNSVTVPVGDVLSLAEKIVESYNS